MKKKTLKTLVAVLAIAAILPSCLGDSHSKAEYNNAISYISDGENSVGSKNALTNTGGAFRFFTADYLKKLSSKKFYSLSYQVNTKNGINADGAYVAHNVMVQGLGDPIPETYAERATTKPTFPLEVHPTDATVTFYTPYKVELNDKFVFSYQCEIDPGDLNPAAQDYSPNLRLEATYDESNQNTTIEGTAGTTKLKPNQIRVNLSLRKEVDYSAEGEKKIKYAGPGAIDLTTIRREFERRNLTPIEGTTTKVGFIVFEYTKDMGDGKTEVRPIGSFSSDGTSGSYGMYLLEEQ